MGRQGGPGRARGRELRRGQPHHGGGRGAGLPQGRRPRDRRRRCTSPPPRRPTRRSSRPRPSRRCWTCRRTRRPRTSAARSAAAPTPSRRRWTPWRPGARESVLVCAADMRLGYPAGPGEMNFGDGAVALLVGADEAHRRGQALRQPLLGDPGHLALGPGHLRAHGRGPLLDGRGLRRRHGAQRGGGPREVRAGRRRRGALRLQRPQRAPGQGRRQEAPLRRADPGQRRAPCVGGRHGLRREPAQPRRGAGAVQGRRDDPPGLLRQRLRHRRPGDHGPRRPPCRPAAASAGTSSPGAS